MNYLKLIVFLLSIHLATLANATPEQPIVLLQAFGTSKNPGRTVAGDATEHSITSQLAQQISSALDQEDNSIEAFIVKPTGQTKKDPLAKLNKINQVDKAIVIQLTASSSKQAKPSCHFFFRCYNPLTDQIKRPVAPLTPVPLEDVYLLNFGQSKTLANTLATQLRTHTSEFLDTSDPVGIPLANLRGIRHPVVQIEVSLNKTDQLMQIGNAIAHGIKKLFPS